MTDFAKWLKARMVQRGISQNQLARDVGISSGMISEITRHGRIPGPRITKALAEYFGDDVAATLELAGHIRLSDIPQDFPREVRGLLRRLYQLPPATRAGVLLQIEGLLVLLEEQNEAVKSDSEVGIQ